MDMRILKGCCAAVFRASVEDAVYEEKTLSIDYSPDFGVTTKTHMMSRMMGERFPMMMRERREMIIIAALIIPCTSRPRTPDEPSLYPGSVLGNHAPNHLPPVQHRIII